MDEKKEKLNEKGTWDEGIYSQKVRSEFPTNELCRLTFAYRVPATTATVFLSRPRSLARSQCPRSLAAQAQGKRTVAPQTDHKRRQAERGQQQQEEQQEEVRWAIVLTTCLGSWIHLQRCSWSSSQVSTDLFCFSFFFFFFLFCPPPPPRPQFSAANSLYHASNLLGFFFGVCMLFCLWPKSNFLSLFEWVLKPHRVGLTFLHFFFCASFASHRFLRANRLFCVCVCSCVEEEEEEAFLLDLPFLTLLSLLGSQSLYVAFFCGLVGVYYSWTFWSRFFLQQDL